MDNMSATTDTGSGLLSKVAIPRLQHNSTVPYRKPSGTRQNRVTRACLNCRTRKIRCSGARPSCATCKDSGTACIYASSRKDRLKTATGQNQEMMELLQDLRDQVSEGGRTRIDLLLASVIVDVADAADSVHKSAEKRDEAEAEHVDREDNTSAEVASPVDADVDLMDEDTSHDAWSRPTSNPRANIACESSSFCKSSGQDAQWPNSSRHRQGHSPLRANISLDNAVLGVSPDLDSFEMPSFEDAERLLRCYMEHCHNSFPFLAKKAFTRLFYDYYAASDRGHHDRSTLKWQAQLNLVFAIGAVYSHLISAPWRGNERDHLIYHSRAWALGMRDPSCLSTPDLSQMQFIGLLSFYNLCTGRVRSSWVLSGMAIRLGFSLGLDSNIKDPTSGAARQEVLIRIWWAHFSLERFVATITGFPSIAVDKVDLIPLPLALSAEDIDETVIETNLGINPAMAASLASHRASIASVGSPNSSHRADPNYMATRLEPANSGSYLRKVAQLGAITQDAVSMYAASTLGQTWQVVEAVIVRLTGELEAWATSLPDGFNFLKFGAHVKDQHRRERNTLDLFYHSAIILITRPCLCRLDRRSSSRATEPNEFNQRSALTCVESAKAVARLLPESARSGLELLYELGPWWTMVQIVTQSLIILLLEISCEAVQLPHDRRETIVLLKKLVRWSRAMSMINEMARHAYLLVMDLLRTLAVPVKMDITDLLQEDDQADGAAEIVVGSRNFSARDAPNIFASPTFQIPAQDVCRKASEDFHSPISNAPYSAPRPRGTLESAYVQLNLSKDSLSASGLAFPGLFFTNYDEENPFTGFGAKDYGMRRFDTGTQRPER